MIREQLFKIAQQIIIVIGKGQSTFFFILSLVLGLIPAFTFVHILAKDANSYYILGESFYANRAFAFGRVTNYGDTPVNSGLNSRAPLYPLFISLSMVFSKKTLLSTYLPLFIVRTLIVPMAYLVSKRHLPPFVAFLSSISLLFFPKLQTYSLSAIEADSFVMLFFLVTVYLYYRISSAGGTKLLLVGLGLGLLILSKETGFPLAIGLVGAIGLESFFSSKKLLFSLKNVFYVSAPAILITAPFFAMTLKLQGLLYANVMTVDKQIAYIPQNLGPIIHTIPLYMGLEELFILPIALRGFILSLVLLALTGIGIADLILKRKFTLILPVFAAILAISSVNTKTMGGNIPANFQLITTMPYVLPPASIMLYSGYNLVIINLLRILRKTKQNLQRGILYIGAGLIFLKILNNYYAKPYTLDYAGEYYVSFGTIVSNRFEIPASVFVKDENGRYMIVRQYMHEFVKKQYQSMKVKVIDSSSKKYFVGMVVLTLVLLAANLRSDNSATEVNEKRSRRRVSL